MRLGKEKTKEILGNVRREMVRNPDITIFELQDALNQRYQHTFDKNFIGKLKNKIHRERANRVSRTIGYELACLEDTINENAKILWEVIDSPKTSNREKMSAMRELRSAKIMLLDAMFNAGIFERQIGKITKEEKFSAKDKELLIRAFDNAFGKQSKGLNTHKVNDMI